MSTCSATDSADDRASTARSPRQKLPAAQPAARAPLRANGRLPAPAKTPAGDSDILPFLNPAKDGLKPTKTHQNQVKLTTFFSPMPTYDKTRTAKDRRKPTKTHQNQAKLTTFLFFQCPLMIKPELSKNHLNTAPLPLDLRRPWPVSKY
jgi:hypothetical protein